MSSETASHRGNLPPSAAGGVTSAAPKLTVAQRRQILLDWNDTFVDFGPRACLHELFRAQCQATPDALAVACGNKAWTYRELNDRAEDIARKLLSHGAARGSIVGLCVDRSLEMVAGMFGILLAGAAYLPLEPHYPADRLAFMLEDARVDIIVTTQDLRDQLPAGSAQWVLLDEKPAAIASGDAAWPKVDPDELAYVIYTSGSTGRPKGVMISHHGAVNTVRDMNARFGVEAGDRVLALSSFCFDLNVYDVFGLLAIGGAIVLPLPEKAREPAHWAELMSSWRITIWNSVPALMEMMVAHCSVGRAEVLSPLRRVFLSGDWINVTLPERIWAMNPRTRIISLGGATEASIWSIFYPIEKVDPTWTSIPYGRPMANQSFYVLDDTLDVCPVGVVGQLHIGGVGVALGYLNRAELTAERFIVDPFSRHDGARLYRTGDLGRYLPDGNIEFLGRMDFQVKIGGYRIELGEIESALVRRPEVAEAVVVAREGKLGHRHLVAYAVCHANQTASGAELRCLLREALPAHMVPARIFVLDSLPLTSNGKVDRKALPTDDHALMSQMSDYAPATDELQAKLAAIWEDAFGISPLGIQENFFDLGGDSLLAASMFARIESELGRSLPLEVMLQCPTIRQLAERLREPAAAPPEWTPVVEFSATGSAAPLFLLPGIGGNVLDFHALAKRIEGRPIYGLQPRGIDGQQEPHACIAEIAAFNLQFVQRIQPQGPIHLAGYSLGGVVAWEMAQQWRRLGRPAGALVLIDSELYAAPEKLPLARRLSLHFRNFRYQSMPGRLAYASALARRLLIKLRRGAEAPSDDDIVQGFVLSPISRRIAGAHLPAWKAYRPDAYSGRVALLRAAARPNDPVDAQLDPLLGWGPFLAGPVEAHAITGAHLEMFRSPNVEALARQIAACLQEDEAAKSA